MNAMVHGSGEEGGVTELAPLALVSKPHYAIAGKTQRRIVLHVDTKTRKQRPVMFAPVVSVHYPEHIPSATKRRLALNIRHYSPSEIQEDYDKLREIGVNAHKQSTRVLTGNKVVDAFTFSERLNTLSKHGLSFYEFWAHRNAFAKKPYIRKFLAYSKKARNYENADVTWYNAYRRNYGSVNIFKPLLAMEYYVKYKPQCVLDFTMGWGGRLVGACALDVPKYIGIDANANLKTPYSQLTSFLQPQTKTDMTLLFQDALKVDYTQWKYDMVFTSPPYYNVEKYKHTTAYATTKDWDELFYRPLFYATYAGLQKGGVYCLNLPKTVYERVCIPLLGKAHQRFPMRLMERNTARKQKEYKEYVYVWKKA
jgi:hypothetical protein